MKSFCRSTAFEELLGVNFGMVSCFIMEKNAIIERTTTTDAAFPLRMPLLPPQDSCPPGLGGVRGVGSTAFTRKGVATGINGSAVDSSFSPH